uniref:DUF6248 family natural product biosynthesis protein n=1 Tax=Amycolatopsis sp. CA-096443 TaxID=3239919 RepID=UPI003F490739
MRVHDLAAETDFADLPDAGRLAAAANADGPVLTRDRADKRVDAEPAPLPSMSDQTAAWIREHAWRDYHRLHYRQLPGFVTHCACQWGASGHCGRGDHQACAAASAPQTKASSETYLTRTSGTVVNGAEVWLADRVCRWTCPCDCGHRTASESPCAPAPTRGERAEQLELFPAR